MKNKILILVILVLLAGTAFVFYRNSKGGIGSVACTMDAKICPDGTAVGRSGPDCSFSECPTIKDSTKAKMSEGILNNGVYITPKKVVSDSRCPVDVKCIWAGEVKIVVFVKSDSQVGSEEKELTLTLGTPVIFDGKEILLAGVFPPASSQKSLKIEEYVFEFQVK